MTKFANLAAPEMRAATSLHSNNARRQLPEELQHLITSQLLWRCLRSVLIGAQIYENI